MFILLTIFLFLFIVFTMLVFYLVRPKFGIQGFLAVLAIVAGWVMVWLARSDIPRELSLFTWKPEALFHVSPSLLIDNISWLFALTLVTLTLTVILTSISHLGRSYHPEQPQGTKIIKVVEERDQLPGSSQAGDQTIERKDDIPPNWQSWAAILVLLAMGLVAVTAGNIATLLIAWSAIDISDVFILMSQIRNSQQRERIVQGFAARIAGIVFLIIAAILLWSQGASLLFTGVSQPVGILLVISAGLRLGVIPVHLPLIQALPTRRGLGTILRLIPAASSYILLVRVAAAGVFSEAVWILLLLTVLVGLFAAGNWLITKDELTGSPFWLLGTASLAVASAILNQPVACLTWSIASLLSGALISSMSLPNRNLFPLILIGLINFSSLPFSPTWLGTGIYVRNSASSQALPPILFYCFALLMLFIQSLMLAGYMRHSIRAVYPAEENNSVHIERWVWFIYPIGLVILIGTHILIGISLVPDLSSLAFPVWIMGAVVSVIAVMIWYASLRYPQPLARSSTTTPAHPWIAFFSLGWLYHLISSLLRLISRLISLLSSILEGEGGILWALVLFALIFVFLQR